MTLNDAKNLALNLLDKVQVKAVYYVDDYLSHDGLKLLLEYIEKNTEDIIRSTIKRIPEEVMAAKEAGVDISRLTQDWWDTVSEDEQERILSKCNLRDENKQPEHHLRQLFGERCVLCTPGQWESSRSNECFEKIKSGEKVLILFDQKLDVQDTTKGEGRDGVKLAQSFSAREAVMENSYCGIFSKQFEVDGEFDFRENYIKDLKSWAFPFSKDRLPADEDYSLFLEGLNNVLWVGNVDRMSLTAKKLIEETSHRISDKFEEIVPQDIKQIVIGSSYNEGCREIDTMLRLIHILFSRELQRSLVETEHALEEFNTNVKTIKDIHALTFKKIKPKYDREKVNAFFQDENFVPASVINPLLMPLQNGDIFCVNGEDYYVLLCQPCNISVRREGKRGNDYDIGYFVPMVEMPTEDELQDEFDKLFNLPVDNIEEAKKAFMSKVRSQIRTASRATSYKVNIGINGKTLFAAMSKYKTISLSLLDYCTFSEDGEVVINKPLSANLHDNQKALCKNHTAYFKKHLDLEHLIKDINEESRVIIQPRIERWFYSFLTWLRIKPDFENSQYIFPIKRYGHFQDPLASDLLTQLSHYISRAGLPNEFE